MPLVGGQVGPIRNLGVQLTLLQPGGQIMLTTLLLAHPEFRSSVHPIPARGADYTHHITACTHGFEIKPNDISG